MEPRDELAGRTTSDAAAGSAPRKTAQEQTARARSRVRTAMSIELRDGVLCAFMPPVEKLEDYLELIAAVEATAEEMQLPVHVEGYPPPYDPRIEVIKVTPDPGVIEVNIQPAQSWREAVDITFGLYEDAAQDAARRQQVSWSTAATPAPAAAIMSWSAARRPQDSPFLRRPDLLKSLVLYWQRHPSLSYLFSGLFIGPTSQAPRIDEARHDGLYELEIALAHVPPPGRRGAAVAGRPAVPATSWSTSPATPIAPKSASTSSIRRTARPAGSGWSNSARFEMPPDPRMSLAQQLLIRALIAKLWREPQQGKFVRWGTTLHDRFMLPHFLWEDFLGVLDELKQSGYDFVAGMVSRRSSSSASRSSAASITAASRWNCARRWSPGTCWARRARPAAPCAMSIPRSSGCRSRPTGFVEGRHVVTCNGRRHADDGDRPLRRGGRRRPLQGLAAGLRACTRPFRCTRR